MQSARFKSLFIAVLLLAATVFPASVPASVSRLLGAVSGHPPAIAEILNRMTATHEDFAQSSVEKAVRSYRFANETPYIFQATYDYETGTISYMINQFSISYRSDLNSQIPFQCIVLSLIGENGTSVEIDHLTINGQSFGSMFADGDSTTEYFDLSGEKDVTIAGFVTFNGQSPSGQLDGPVTAGNGDSPTAPIAGTVWLFGTGLASLFGFKIFRRDRRGTEKGTGGVCPSNVR